MKNISGIRKYFALLALAVMIFAGAWIWFATGRPAPIMALPTPPPNPPSATPIAQADYVCDGDKIIEASYFQGAAQAVKPGEPPMPSGSVKLVLSDGRKLELSQTISADGSRYANSDGSFVFWSKGNGALVLENDSEKDFSGCLILKRDPGGLPNVFHDGVVGFSIRYPAGYMIDTAYEYQGLGPGKGIGGAKLTVPADIAVGTNLSGFDTGVSIESIPAVQDCHAGLFLDGNVNTQTVSDSGTDYSFTTMTQGAAGNRYEEDVWAIPGSDPCVAVRYLVHSTVIENYPAGTVSEFDRTGLLGQFDKIRRTLTTP
jgi:membrane-bound inhibitor of C-type lysozyme